SPTIGKDDHAPERLMPWGSSMTGLSWLRLLRDLRTCSPKPPAYASWQSSQPACPGSATSRHLLQQPSSTGLNEDGHPCSSLSGGLCSGRTHSTTISIPTLRRLRSRYWSTQDSRSPFPPSPCVVGVRFTTSGCSIGQ